MEKNQKLKIFLETLIQWNKKLALIGPNEEQNISNSIADALCLNNILSKTNGPIFDLGSGNGIPAIINCIYLPEKKFFLIDANTKKSIFLQEVARILKLHNVSIINDRVEKTKINDKKIIITARALTKINDILNLTSHWENKSFYLLKGQNWKNEIIEAQKNWDFNYKKINIDFSVLININNCKNKK